MRREWRPHSITSSRRSQKRNPCSTCHRADRPTDKHRANDTIKDHMHMGTTPASTLTIGRALDGAVAILTMEHRPYNLLDKAFVLALIDALRWTEEQQARAVILRSGLRHFSAGAELDSMLAETRDSDVLDWHLVDLLDAFDAHPAPIVAAVHGTCVGGGFELALACDLVVAAASTKFGSVEVTVGLQPLMGGVQRIAQRAGAARAKEIALLGRRYDAATLERWNIINRVVPDEDLDTATMVLAQELAHGPTLANIATKQLVSVAVNRGTAAADEAMAELQRPVFRSEDFVTGVTSYRDNGIGQAFFEGR
ncbi:MULTISPECIES: enoyl-CoA hydratase/isomerase family protein [Microbacterium]|nr:MULTISPECIES: enoyl-CoA hydratase/isomerase family protein [unclassified Microbacterium]